MHMYMYDIVRFTIYSAVHILEAGMNIIMKSLHNRMHSCIIENYKVKIIDKTIERISFCKKTGRVLYVTLAKFANV